MPGPAPGRPRPGARLNWRIRTLATSCGDPSHPSVWTKPAPRFSPEPTAMPPKTGQQHKLTDSLRWKSHCQSSQFLGDYR